MQKIYCGICGVQSFETIEERNAHERSCKGKLVTFKCHLCGRVITYYETLGFNPENQEIKDRCHVLDAGTMGSGSKISGHKYLNVCDDCLAIHCPDEICYEEDWSEYLVKQ